ncbi:MAG: hypothetical protein M1833_004681 [Piccolia ochrophora]|nr:MAG: hypothetical protein M1833_004681 [Piccolia ochrophora]
MKSPSSSHFPFDTSSTDEHNPFIAFRRYADAQFNALLENLTGSSPAPSEQSTMPFWMGRHDEESCRDRWRRRHRPTSTADGESGNRHIMQVQRPDGAVSIPVRTCSSSRGRSGRRQMQNSAQEQEPEVQHPLLQELSPFLQSLVSSVDLSSARDALPQILSGGSISPHTTGVDSPLHYILFSDYSPVHLESQLQQQDRSHRNPQWREAFEDLLTEDGVQIPHRPQTTSEKRAESPESWILRLMGITSQGGLRGPEERRQQGPRDHALAFLEQEHSSFDEDEKNTPQTEQDLYERFLGAYDPTPSPARAPQVGTTPSSANPPRPSILSTLTTTERTTAPDGSTHTRTVLKKRFADGREESSEITHSTPAAIKAEAEKAKSATRSRGDAARTQKGWFWSG